MKKYLKKILKKPGKKILKKTGKNSVHAVSFAERTRGVIAFILGATLITSAIIASSEGVVGIKDLARYLMTNWMGRLILAVLGFAYVVYGAWKIIRGEN